jgi:drug/metabolite transporter (DMT)-like permease
MMLQRIFWNSITINCLYVCLHYVPLSITVVLLNMAPIFSFFIDAILFKVSIAIAQKPISKVHISLAIVSFCGVYLIFKPSPGEDWNPWMIFGIVSALANCINYAILHSMKGTFKESIILEYTYLGHYFSNAILICILANL